MIPIKCNNREQKNCKILFVFIHFYIYMFSWLKSPFSKQMPATGTLGVPATLCAMQLASYLVPTEIFIFLLGSSILSDHIEIILIVGCRTPFPLFELKKSRDSTSMFSTLLPYQIRKIAWFNFNVFPTVNKINCFIIFIFDKNQPHTFWQNCRLRKRLMSWPNN